MADDPFGDDPPADPNGSGNGSSPRNSASRNGRPAAPVGTPPPTGGIGQPSASDGQQQSGTVGVGLPSFAAGARPQDVRPKRSVKPPWAPSTTLRIEAPLDLVVACDASGVVLHPGGYRLSPASVRQPGALVRDLETIVQNHALIDPTVRPRPRLQFLVKPGGSETFEAARRQTVLAGLDWPVSIQTGGPLAPRVFPKERF
jgi:hypothetical protein